MKHTLFEYFCMGVAIIAAPVTVAGLYLMLVDDYLRPLLLILIFAPLIGYIIGNGICLLIDKFSK